jgi:hypothetical protein
MAKMAAGNIAIIFDRCQKGMKALTYSPIV